MKSNEKKILITLVVVAIIIIGVVWFVTRPKEQKGEQTQNNTVKEEFVQVLQDGTKLNTSTKLGEKKTLEGLEIGNIQLTNNNGQTVLLADVTNPGSKDTQVMLINIILYDKTGKELGTVNGIVSPVKAGEKVQLNCGTMDDLANAYDFKVVKK